MLDNVVLAIRAAHLVILGLAGLELVAAGVAQGLWLVVAVAVTELELLVLAGEPELDAAGALDEAVQVALVGAGVLAVLPDNPHVLLGVLL